MTTNELLSMSGRFSLLLLPFWLLVASTVSSDLFAHTLFEDDFEKPVLRSEWTTEQPSQFVEDG
ncbi:MAG: hypothetical protein K9M02_03115 [Thiohalocapsa sp.]|nr:hypothetical protein [Thiohalocapsa sp.]